MLVSGAQSPRLTITHTSLPGIWVPASTPCLLPALSEYSKLLKRVEPSTTCSAARHTWVQVAPPLCPSEAFSKVPEGGFSSGLPLLLWPHPSADQRRRGCACTVLTVLWVTCLGCGQGSGRQAFPRSHLWHTHELRVFLLYPLPSTESILLCFP